VICKTATGNSVGVEICQWAHEKAMRDGRLTDRVNSNVLAAIGPQPIRKAENFWIVVFHATAKVCLFAGEYAAFREAFFDLIDYIDRSWPNLKHRGRPYPFSDLEKFKPLNKYIEKVTFCPPNDESGTALGKADETRGSVVVVTEAGDAACEWIVPACRAQWFRTPHDHCGWEGDDNGNMTMEGGLLKMLKRKAEKGGTSRLKAPCSDVHLLIAFHEAIQYCPPIPKMRDLAQEAVDRARCDGSWPFRGAYLLCAVEDHPWVCRVV